VKRGIALGSAAESLMPSGLFGFVQSHGNHVQSIFVSGITVLIIQADFSE